MRPTRSAAAAVLLALVLAACGSPAAQPTIDPTVGAVQPEPPAPAPVASSTSPAPAPTAEVSSSPEPVTTAETSESAEPVEPAEPALPAEPATTVADPEGVALALEPFATLEAPTAMALRPGQDTVWISERPGRVRPVAPDGTVGDAVVDLTGDTTTSSERGLLGLTWSADGDTLYLSFTDTDGANVLAAVPVVDGVLRDDQRRVVLRVPQPASNHNGGDLHLGPDGHLWWALGDGGRANDAFGMGQDPGTLLATIVRLDPDGGDPYAIPADNPFVGGGGAAEVWAYGLRNPWRFAFDPPTGSVWIADVGQNAVEEINRVAVGAGGLNYGWPRFEGDRPFDGREPDGPVVAPVHTYDHARGCSITGGRVYRGDALDRGLRGAYLYSDYCDGRIFALAVTADGEVAADVDTGLAVDAPVAFGEDADGELYVLSLNGSVQKVVGG